jgi:hypothetical protein
MKGPVKVVALGAGSLPEELFGVCYRMDCALVKMLRKRVLRYVARLGVPSASSELVAAVDRAIKRIGYVAEGVHDAVVEEYARVLQLDIPPREDVFKLLGGQPGWTFEDLLYLGDSPAADALHEAMVALYMQYVEGGDVEKLGAADFAAYAAVELLREGRMPVSKAKELLNQITNESLAL